MEDLIFKIVLSLVIIGFVYVAFIRPKYWFRKQINQVFFNELRSELNLIQIDDLTFENKKSNFYTVVIFIKPSNQLLDKITMRIMVNFKPFDDFKKQKEKIKKLNELNNYHWVANMVSKDIEFLTKRPSIEIIKKEISNMTTMINKEEFEGINKEDSINYGNYWDIEIEK
ncbi:MAG: hypothetical protein H6600_05195 [Flavobacteriales bacterium]|nr:hypothetical protein [Flavobacteriales bacterium]